MTQPANFGFDEDERLLRDSVRRLLDEAASIAAVRSLVAGSHEDAYERETPPARYDEGLWRRMVELGWPALAVPESRGGAGMKFVAAALLAEEIGRHALPTPLATTLQTTMVLRAADSAAAGDWLARIAAGQSATLATAGPAGTWEPESTDVRVSREGTATFLEGTSYFVQDARKAAFFLLAARSGTGVGLYAVRADAPGVSIAPDHIVDLTRDQARLRLDRAEAEEIAPPGKGREALTAAMPALLTLVAADIAGAAEWQLQTTVEYAKIRTQFDRPLGFFQAVKHPIVDMMVEIDRTRSLVWNAACAIDAEPAMAERYARMAKASASDTAAFCSGRSVQLHGGIGFTWECDVHLYFKRQKHSQMLYGDAAWQRRKLGELLGRAA